MRLPTYKLTTSTLKGLDLDFARSADQAKRQLKLFKSAATEEPGSYSMVSWSRLSMKPPNPQIVPNGALKVCGAS